MLLIGSRAIRVHFPEFREPRDWDLVGTQSEIDWLATKLPLAGPQRPEKAHFRLEKRLVEVANASLVPYWGKVLELFTSEPQIKHEVFGPTSVAPPGFLLLTKHCGLIYRVVHWHKNLEDLYFLRDRIPTIPAPVSALIADAMADSERMFAVGHDKNKQAFTCHPSTSGPLDGELHSRLHQRFAHEGLALCEHAGCWSGFVQRNVNERKHLMLQLFAEEAQVVAAQAWIEAGSSNASIEQQHDDQWIRWALRTLCTGELPAGLRYFVVNYYREIRASIPANWADKVRDLLPVNQDFNNPCSPV